MKNLSIFATVAFLLPVLAFGYSNKTGAKHAVSMKQATKTALAKVPGTIKSKELEREKGRDIYSFDIQTKDGIHEVNVDANSGAAVEDKIESPADEAKEKQQDRKQRHNAKPNVSKPTDK